MAVPSTSHAGTRPEVVRASARWVSSWTSTRARLAGSMAAHAEATISSRCESTLATVLAGPDSRTAASAMAASVRTPRMCVVSRRA